MTTITFQGTNFIKACRGSTMIEVLVAVLVFSVGLLGIATTQTLGLTTSQSALHRSQAAQLTYELIDIIRMNPGETDLDFDSDAATASIFSGYDSEVNDYSSVAACVGAGSGCTTTEMATTRMAYWEDRLAESLPESRAFLTLNGNVYTVTVQWSDFRNNQDRIDAATDCDGDGSTADDAALACRTTDFRI